MAVDWKRLDDVLAEVSSTGSATIAFERLCSVSVELLSVSGMGAMVMSGGQYRGTLFTSDPRAKTMEDLEYSLGEGPCVQAYDEQRIVLVNEVASDGSWPAFTSAAREAGLAAIFAVPLQAYGARIGALSFYRDEPGPLGDDEVEGARVLASAAARLVPAVLAEQPPGWLPPSLERIMQERLCVYQATGMVAVQMQTGVEEALAYLRAHSWAHGRSLGEVATDVVERRLTFAPYDSPG